MRQLRAVGISEEKFMSPLTLFHSLYQGPLNGMRYFIPPTQWARLAMERNAELVSENLSLFLESDSVVGVSQQSRRN
jgi:hypothetical protein